jgi:hypothetical protein
MTNKARSKAILRSSSVFAPSEPAKRKTLEQIKRRENADSVIRLVRAEKRFYTIAKQGLAAAALLIIGLNLGLQDKSSAEKYSIENYRHIGAYIMRSETIRQFGDAIDSCKTESKEKL